MTDTKDREVQDELERLRRRSALVDAVNRVMRETLGTAGLDEVGAVCLSAAEEVTGSRFGFIGEINERGLFDTHHISNPGWDQCGMPDDRATLVIKDMSLDGVDRSTMREGVSRIVNDLESHPDHKEPPTGHPKVHCFLGVPLKEEGRVIGMIGLGNREGGYTEAEREDVETLADAVAQVLRRRRTEQLVARQSREMLELSTPIMQVWEGVVVAPLIGSLDSRRMQQFMERLLEAVVASRSEIALVDITGVPTIDTQTAQHLIEATSAVRLLGAQVVLTGVRPAIAQTLVHLGIDLSDVVTRASLSAGLSVAMDLLGLEVRRTGEA